MIQRYKCTKNRNIGATLVQSVRVRIACRRLVVRILVAANISRKTGSESSTTKRSETAVNDTGPR